MLHLDMGKYAMFVWPAWGLSVLVIGGLTWRTISTARAAGKALARAEGSGR